MEDIFEKCKQYTLDFYWKEIFDECSNGRFPKNLKYNGKTLTVFFKNETSQKVERFQLFSSNDKKNYKILMTIFKHKLQLRSPSEIYIVKQTFDNLKDKLDTQQEYTKWSKIKPKYLKNKLIIQFVNGLQDLCNLSDIEAQWLLSTINLGFKYKTIISDNVVLENSKIKLIRGLVFNKSTKTFEITNKININKKSKKQNKQNKMLFYIDKYVKFKFTY